MIQLKKTLLTLVALLAVTIGAWAEDTTLFELNGRTETTGTLTLGTNSVGPNNVRIHKNTLSVDAIKMDSNYSYADGVYFTIKPETGSFKAGDKLSIAVCYNNSVESKTAKAAIYAADHETLLYTTANGINGRTSAADPAVEEYVLTQDADLLYIGRDGNIPTFVTTLKVVRPASSTSAVTVDWNKASKTGTFTMPAGNVAVSVEYFPQAALTEAPTAINDVPATTDGAIVKAGTVANIGSTETAQGTVMYYVSTTALDDAALLALAADQWKADVPTAESLAEGQAYVYYYVRGNDSDTDEENFSDGDILAANALTVTIAAAPTYAVTFAKDNPEPDKWSAEPNTGLKKGQTVTVTYTGDRKVIGVKAEKYVPRTLADATTADVGMVVCAAGHLHDAKTAVPSVCTAVGILGKVTTTGHGLILALKNATNQNWNTINGWTSASYAGTTLKVLPDGARGTNLTSYTTLGETTVSNWAVAQKSDYAAIFANLGSTKGDNQGRTFDGNVNAYITTGVGGTAISGDYWSATSSTDAQAWRFISDYWGRGNKQNSKTVRPVLGF